MINSTTKLNWEDFIMLDPKELAPLLCAQEGVIQSLIFTQQITRKTLDHLIILADYLNEALADVTRAKYIRSLLATKSCSLYFTQCSTRTYTSFSFAAQTLGMMVEEIRDAELSSQYKGESEIDTLLTLAYLSDVIVMRQMNGELTKEFAYEIYRRGLPTRIINGGSGSDQHPTQALLELYTLSAHLDLLDSSKPLSVAFVGDLKRSRTARSLSYLLALYPHVRQLFVAPDELQMSQDIQHYLKMHNVQFECMHSLKQVIPEADAFYMMRIQDEYSEISDETSSDYKNYYLTSELVSSMKPSACILHPLPRRNEIPLEIDLDPRAKYWDGVRRGKLIRVALLMHMFGIGELDQLR